MDTYTVIITGTLPMGITATKTFTLDVINQCLTATITLPTPPSTYVYKIIDSIQSESLPKMTSSDALCSIAYTLTKSDGTVFDASVITSYTGSSNTITIYSNDNSKVGTMNLKLSGKILYGPDT
jgi:hypothetical protein